MPSTRNSARYNLLGEQYQEVLSLFLETEGQPFRKCPTGKDVLGRVLYTDLVQYHHSPNIKSKTKHKVKTLSSKDNVFELKVISKEK